MEVEGKMIITIRIQAQPIRRRLILPMPILPTHLNRSRILITPSGTVHIPHNNTTFPIDHTPNLMPQWWLRRPLHIYSHRG
jgi:hypothetical protein